MRFKDRKDAGRRLAAWLRRYAEAGDAIVLGIPRGGVIVAAEVAREIHAPLDVFLSIKLGVPGHEELAFGAVAAGGSFLNERVIREAGISEDEIERASHEARERLRDRELLFRRGRLPLSVQGRTVILVDDGVATGASLFASISALRLMSPRKLAVAVPVAPRPVCDWLRPQVDEFVTVACPLSFHAVGEFYDQFTQVSDEEVLAALGI